MWGEENGKGKEEMGDSHTFAIEVKHFKNCVFISCLVDANISDLFQ